MPRVPSTVSSSARTPSAPLWPEAKAIVAEWEAAGSWSGPVKPIEPAPVAPAPADTSSSGITITDAIQAYLTIREGLGIAPATQRKHRTFAKQLGEFAATRGYVMLDQLRSTDVDVFYANWKLGPRAKGNALGTLRGFFRFCTNREWLTKSPVTSDLKPPLGANWAANKIPFTDEELQRIVRACDQLEPISWSNGKTSGVWTGEDVKDLIWVLVYTGRTSVCST